MTYYHSQVLLLQKQLYAKAHWCEKVIQARSFIDQNFSSNIALDDIASEVFLSRFHFIRLFKKMYGRTPHQYMVAVRIMNAKTLLRAGVPVAETCFAIGFDSITTFTGLFRRMTGSTPAVFQKKAILKKAV